MIARPPVLFSLLLISGCAEVADVGTEAQLAGPSGGGINETQGRYYLGSLADGLQPSPLWTSGSLGVKNATSTQFTLLGADHTCLVATIGGQLKQCADPAFNGYTFSAGALSYTIVASAPVASSTPAGGMRTGYRLQDATGADYCAGGHLAHPVPGKVLANGVTYATWTPPAPPTELSWACTAFLANGVKDPALAGNGVLGKAIDWGFRTEHQLQSMTGTPAAIIPGLELAAVATRMGRADYCHDGEPHTLEGSAIAYLDLVNGNDVPNASGPIETSPTDAIAGGAAVPVPSNQYFLEAVWTRPTVLSDSTDTARPLCLSKLRWQSLPLGTRCGTLEDPRVDPDGVFCDDWPSYEATANEGGVVVNASKRNDAGLWRWRHVVNGDHYTTTVGAYNGDKPSVLPAKGYTTATEPQLLGTLLTDTGKALFEANYAPAVRGVLTQVQSCKQTGGTDWLTTAPAVFAGPPGYGTCKFEGWMWTGAPPALAITDALGWEMRPLYVWKKGAEYLTTTASPVVGYTNVATLGWIIAPNAW